MYSKTHISMHTDGDIGVHTQTCTEVYTQDKDKHVHTGKFSQIYTAVYTHTGIYTNVHADTYRVYIQAHGDTGTCTCRHLCIETHKHACINNFSQMHTDPDR